MECYTDEEIELAKSYLTGQHTEVQMNYLAHQCGSSKKRMEDLVEKMSRYDPMTAMCKVVIGMILMHFAACTIYAIITIKP